MPVKKLISKNYLEEEYLKKHRLAKDIAKELNCSTVTLFRRLREFNLLKGKYEAKDNSFYRETSEKYYWIGFLFADGGISEKNEIAVGLSIKDVKHLENLQMFVGFNRNGKYFKLQKTKNNKYNSCRLSFGNKYLTKYLKNQYNLVERKTHIAKPTNIPDKYSKDFILGYFDGDGSIFQTKRGDIICSIVGSKPMMNYISNWSEKNCYKKINVTRQKAIWGVRWGEFDSYCFLARLYDKKNISLCLKRKYKIFKKLKEKIEKRYKSLIKIYEN